MSEQVEATGRTLEEAKRIAAEMLGVDVSNCEFEVVEQAAKGLFAKTNVRIRATVKQASEREETPIEQDTKDEGSQAEAVREVKSNDSADTYEDELPPVEPDNEDARKTVAMMQGLLDASELKVNVDLNSITGRYVNLQLTGEDVGFLIEPSHPIIDTLQFLGNSMISRSVKPGVRLTLDASEYRKQRAELLEKQAIEIAKAVIDRKQEAVLDPLPAHERRVIHQALAEIEGVETYSEGEEPMRRVVITPKEK